MDVHDLLFLELRAERERTANALARQAKLARAAAGGQFRMDPPRRMLHRQRTRVLFWVGGVLIAFGRRLQGRESRKALAHG